MSETPVMCRIWNKSSYHGPAIQYTTQHCLPHEEQQGHQYVQYHLILFLVDVQSSIMSGFVVTVVLELDILQLRHGTFA